MSEDKVVEDEVIKDNVTEGKVSEGKYPELKDNEEYVFISMVTIVVKKSIFFYKTYKIKTNDKVYRKERGIEVWDCDNKILYNFYDPNIISFSLRIILRIVVDKNTREIIRLENIE